MKVAIIGAAGRMGIRLVHAVLEADGLEVAGAIERSGHPQLGQDIGRIAGVDELGVLVSDDLAATMNDADVLIDFTFPDVTLNNLEICAKLGKMVVSGSTGFTPEQRAAAEQYAKQIPVVLAPNMSVGVNACFKLLKETAKILGDDFDVEVVELHHNKKKDSPSGTAVRMGEVVADALGRDYNQVANYHREGMCGERSPQEIGMQTVRGGDIVGEHTVYFIGMGERIEISHRAMSRDMFARGAARACQWIAHQGPGIYDMQDVLNLK
ncbi:MAG: 4-hydroxy-tetrahydrodipicolinate reductase [Desulfuromonas sp.]|nr:MAG: 4-hydroxy-tetrahydrodipicolinate reductase [Desulfuromonas sp.]